MRAFVRVAVLVMAVAAGAAGLVGPADAAPARGAALTADRPDPAR